MVDEDVADEPIEAKGAGVVLGDFGEFGFDGDLWRSDVKDLDGLFDDVEFAECGVDKEHAGTVVEEDLAAGLGKVNASAAEEFDGVGGNDLLGGFEGDGANAVGRAALKGAAGNGSAAGLYSATATELLAEAAASEGDADVFGAGLLLALALALAATAKAATATAATAAAAATLATATLATSAGGAELVGGNAL